MPDTRTISRKEKIMSEPSNGFDLTADEKATYCEFTIRVNLANSMMELHGVRVDDPGKKPSFIRAKPIPDQTLTGVVRPSDLRAALYAPIQWD
jgi:hypothetical protein